MFENQPYFSIADYYKKKFGEKVYKVPVSVADDCPNRRGLKGMETCIFCDEWGSAAYPETREEPLKVQFERNSKIIRKRYKANSFLVYLQSYTNSFDKLSLIEERFEQALECEGVKGIVIGTRPDCLSQGLIKLWNRYAEKAYLSVELGVQSFENRYLKYMKRGHSSEKSIEAIHRLKNECQADLGIHLMFGWPGETAEEVLRAAEISSSLPIDHIKLHNVHVLVKTELEKIYKAGEFEPVSLETYADWVQLFLENLRSDIAVHRLGAVAPRWDELVAPEWTRYKMGTAQFIIDQMKGNESFQGKSL